MHFIQNMQKYNNHSVCHNIQRYSRTKTLYNKIEYINLISTSQLLLITIRVLPAALLQEIQNCCIANILIYDLYHVKIS